MQRLEPLVSKHPLKVRQSEHSINGLADLLLCASPTRGGFIYSPHPRGFTTGYLLIAVLRPKSTDCRCSGLSRPTGVQRETVGAYLKAAGIHVRPQGAWGRRAAVKPANKVTTDSDPAKPVNEAGTDLDSAKPINEVTHRL